MNLSVFWAPEHADHEIRDVDDGNDLIANGTYSGHRAR